MRLIDADELKKSFTLSMWKEHNPFDVINLREVINQTLDFIDNAPTVPLPDFKEGYKQAIIDGKTNFSRPQGEWITICTLPVIHKCSLCGVEYSSDAILYGNFCSNCGAKMRTEKFIV